MWAESEVIEGVHFTAAVPPGPERDALAEKYLRDLTRKAEVVDEAAAELRDLVERHESVQLLMSVAVPTSTSFDGRGPRADDARETVELPAKLEYLLGLALAVGGRGAEDTPSAVTARVMDLIDDVFDGVMARNTLASPHDADDPAGVAETAFMLRQEHVFDRMPGYATHLQEIDEAIFEPHRGHYVDALGFCPGDVVRVTRMRIGDHSRRVNESFQRGKRQFQRDRTSAALAAMELIALIESSRRWIPDEVAELVELDPRELNAMFAFFSSEFGCQPEFRLPTDTSAARTRPFVPLADGSYFIIDPWALAGAVHARLAEAVTDEPRRLDRYRRHRDDGHQRLVASAFSSIFGPDLVWENQHYVSNDGPGEIDVLVGCDSPLVVEAKAGSLTPAGRRGAPKRVGRVAEDIVAYAFDQTRRASSYIVDEAGTSFADRQAGKLRRLLDFETSSVVEVIVTFERMDPIAMNAPALADAIDREVWTVCLTDLFMIRDILRSPGPVHHYARTRASMARHGPIVFMESDATGAYLIDRVRTQLARAQAEPEAVFFLGYESERINAFYTDAEIGRPSAPPAVGVPAEIQRLLGDTARERGWAEAVDVVMDVPDQTWRRWKTFFRRHRSGEFVDGTLRLRLGGGQLAIVIADTELRSR